MSHLIHHRPAPLQMVLFSREEFPFATASLRASNKIFELGLYDLRFTVKVSLADQALATSGDYQKYYTPDLKHHHIIDPTRGYSSPELASATVVAPTGMSADGYATSLMVLGVEKGWEIMESLPDVEALMVTKTGLVKETSGFGSLAG